MAMGLLKTRQVFSHVKTHTYEAKCVKHRGRKGVYFVVDAWEQGGRIPCAQQLFEILVKPLMGRNAELYKTCSEILGVRTIQCTYSIRKRGPK